jgi:hypothetical protein
MIALFSFQLWHWGEGGTVRGCPIVADNSDTTPCVPAEDSQVSGSSRTIESIQSSRKLNGSGGFCAENSSRM